MKRLDPARAEVTTLAGSGEPGYADGPAAEARFNEPAGICAIGGTLYVADTNNHAIRTVDTATGDVGTVHIDK